MVRSASLPALSNTVIWETHCGCYWSKVYTFTAPDPETWGSAGERRGAVGADHVGPAATAARAEGEHGEPDDRRHDHGAGHQPETRTHRLARQTQARRLGVHGRGA